MATLTRPAPLSEREFQRQVTDLAEMLGWSWAHFRAAQTMRGWRTPVSGPMGAGWVDLMLARRRDRRFVLAELKAEKGKLSIEQSEVVDLLRQCGLEVHVWRPADMVEIAEILR